MKEESVSFPCGQIFLEGVLGLPEGKSPFPAVVVCHPHPLYGGSMDNNVVDAVCAALGREKVAWLRFNFRGVGRSGGRFAEGIGEQDDVKSALTFLMTLGEIDPAMLALCGYSFGAAVAITVADADERVQAMEAISPVLELQGLLKNYARPKLFICGDEDEFINHQELGRIVSELPDPKIYECIYGADHFWRGLEKELEAKSGSFFTSVLKRK